MTQADAVNWLTSQIGKKLDYDNQFGFQCVDFFNFYYQFLSGDNPYTDGFGVPGAKDIWNVPTSFFSKLPDSPTLVPQPGDVLIYGASWGAGFGHVEVCLATDANGSMMVGENEHGNPLEGVVKVYRNWAQTTGLIGVLRPKFNQVKGDTMTIPDQDNWFWRMGKLMKQIRGRDLSRDEFRKYFVGVEQFHMVEILSDDPEADASTTAQDIGQQAVAEGWQKQLTDLTAANADLTKKLAVAQAGNGDATKFQTLRVLLRELLGLS